jgi:hypothetical protein
MAMYAQVEAVAGSLKIGAHVDTAYRWSGESKKHPICGSDYCDVGWVGYDSVNMGDVYVELTGKVGDRISFKILEGLIGDNVTGSLTDGALLGQGPTLDIHNEPFTTPFTMEAYIDIKVIDQLKFRMGKQITSTLLANTGVHKSSVVHTANAPLIANGVIGGNQRAVQGATGFPKVQMPDSVTGAAVIASFSGIEASYTWFDNWLLHGMAPGPHVYGGDALYDFNKTKGGNVAVGYSGEVGPGKLAARGFYFDEDSEVGGIGSGGFWRTQGWGLGASYTHTNFFLAMEYANSTLTREKNATVFGEPNDNNWWGLYFTLAGKFSGIEPVYRFDYIDYTDWGNNNSATIDSYDTEMWHTIGVNYWFNDNAMVGLDYVIKVPEVAKYYKYPTINELVLFVEVDTL